jgi:TRAP-type C4-dicarboxylate transport system permease small subunit
VLAWLGLFSVLALVLLIGQDVFMRYVLNSPTRWTLETAMGIQLFFGFLCAGYVLREGGHIRMQLLIEHVSRKTRLWLYMITSILGFFLCVILVYYAWLMTASSYRVGELTALVAYPIWWLKSIIFLGFFLLGLQFIAETYKYYRQIKGADDDKD